MAGKISFLFLLISVGVYVLINEKRKRRIFFIVVSFLCIVLLPVLFLDFNWVQSIFSSAMERRGQIFKVAYVASLENLPFGIGTSDIKNELENYYIRYDFKDLIGLSTHNTFLSFTLRFGIMGALAYFGYLLYSVKIAVKTKNPLLPSLLVILFLSSLTEHVFETHRGRFFFIFFLSFLHYVYNTGKNGTNSSSLKNLLNDQKPIN
ncbi:O-antigen ligase family protein [Aquimarina mytili]|uniref:O-antigen ligase family protein n=2 Tax=Aquimarina mytili TaxID=874423 RepID=A0A936ZUQ0_9FLAO|nr:O-antigen ligase family protein [Aquimarina mytili]MBL0684667.1 O-antigen ligase family protein [Aquimarina mytili]